MRRGSWSRVIKTGADFIPMKFCGVPSCLALGVGALSGRGAGGRVPYCLRVIPRVQAAHCPADLLYADTRRPSDGEVDPLGENFWLMKKEKKRKRYTSDLVCDVCDQSVNVLDGLLDVAHGLQRNFRSD